MDPLSILKEFCLNGQLDQVQIDDDRIRFSDKYSFPKQSPTAFKAKDGTGDFYSLEAVTFFIKSIVANPNMGQYVAAAVRTKTHQIELRDREPLRDYLTGKVPHTVHIADVVPTVNFYEPAAKKQRVEEPESAEGEAAALKHLFEQERQLRDRNTLLCVPGANFKSVLDMVDKVQKARLASEAAQGNAKAAAAAAGKPQQRPAAAGQQQQRPQQQQQPKPAGAQGLLKPSMRMERGAATLAEQMAPNVDASITAQLGKGYGFQVEPSKPAAGAGAGPGSGAAGAAAAGGRPGSGQQQHRSSKGGGHTDPRAAAAAAAAAAKHQKGGSSSGAGAGVVKHRDPPIILVPTGVTAMVNIFNAKQLLEEGKFVRSDEAAAAVGSVKPTKAVEFNRTALRNGPRFPRYQITDKVPRVGHPDWKRVVAVIVQGKAWQFKDYPFKGADRGELMETFNNVYGAYFYYSDEKVPETVDSWKVVKLPLRRTARHLDHTAMLDFYTKLDAFLAGRRCELDY